MNKIELTIDGTQVTAQPGETILQVVRRLGWSDRVPTLCYEPDLPPYTSCFVCVVEQEGVGKLLPACSSLVAPGMVLHTKSERVMGARQTALQLLLSNHPADCVAPCSRGCPAGVDVQTYLWQAQAGEEIEAVKTIRKRNPLPIVCGRVCVRRCEDVCRRGILDDPVGINMVKRSVSDGWKDAPYEEATAPDTGKHVAVVGGGPAGLTAAYFLRLAGHGVTIYEAHDKLGGMLRWGIPDYRLPQDLLDWEIQQILDLGVAVKTGVEIGREVTLDGLRQEHDAVLLTIGAQAATSARIRGEDHPRVLSGIDYLLGVKQGKAGEYGVKGKKVVVVGGGNTAIDAARTSLRLEASHVSILYRRTRKEMPANAEEIVAADNEGVRLEFLIAPVAVEAEGDKLKGLICQKMQLGEPDASGRRRPVPVPDSDHLVQCDLVIGAIGQKVRLGGLQCADEELSISRWGTINGDEYSMATNVPGLFVGGDCLTGPAVAIDAIGHGRRAALSICQYLEVGEPSRIFDKFSSRRENFGEILPNDLPEAAAWPRAKQPEMDHKEAIGTFEECELTLSEHEAQKEVERCLQCGCVAREECTLRDLADEYGLGDSVSGQTRRRKVDTSHPHITMDPNKCILCTRCVRTCGDILGVSALGLVDRGFETIVAPTMGDLLAETNCISCGNCVEACPTGALGFKELTHTAAARTSVESVCTLCPELCPIVVTTNEFGVAVRNSKKANGSNHPICEKGRYENVERLTSKDVGGPMVRLNGALQPVTLDEAVAAAVQGMQEAVSRYGAAATVVSGGGQLANEEAAAVARLGGELLGATAGSISLTAAEGRVNGDEDLSTVCGEKLVAARWVLCLGEDPMETTPVAAARLRRAVRNEGEVVAVMQSPSAITRLAHYWFGGRRGTESTFLGWCLRNVGVDDIDGLDGCTDEQLQDECGITVEQASGLLARIAAASGSVVGLYNPHGGKVDRTVARYLAALVKAVRPEDENSGLLVMRSEANSAGVRQAGLLSAASATAIQEQLQQGGFKAAWLVRDGGKVSSKAVRTAEFLVVQDCARGPLLDRADVVLPATLSPESDGSYVAWDGRSYHVKAAVTPRHGVTTLDVLNKAAELAGK